MTPENREKYRKNRQKNQRRILRKKKENLTSNAVKARDLHRELVYSISSVYFF